ncbi:MAG TPA: NAD-dependent epimerase/dehydratase family protein [Magnetococcales bacterium]|nr:NAD-dependent epimerase/dehydratase family protein [Magnetococcales bacterium]
MNCVKKIILLIGGKGFVGTHIHAMLCDTHEVIQSDRECDVRHQESLNQLIRCTKPHWVIHLAAVTTVRDSFKEPDATHDINFLGTKNLLLALKQNNFSGRLLYVCSSEIYGIVDEADMPVTEAQALSPISPYAVTKIAAENLCCQWSQSELFHVCVARPFNHFGPGQSDRFVVSEFARQICEIKLGRGDGILRVGDIDATRDFTDVRDVVRAYQLILERGKNGECYNVCSGIEVTVRHLMERLAMLAGITIRVQKDPARLRQSEQRRMRGSYAKLAQDTGWKPEIPLDQSLRDILTEWEAKLS